MENSNIALSLLRAVQSRASSLPPSLFTQNGTINGNGNNGSNATVSVPSSVASDNSSYSATQRMEPSWELQDLPNLRLRVRNHVDEAIRLLPPDVSQAYREAMQKAPDVVKIETDPLQFVRFCGYDHYAGARRLCQYWTDRKCLFGPDRAFLPMILTGNGALTQDEVMMLQAGYPALLPDTERGQKVIFFDRRKLIPQATTDMKLKCLFYIFCIIAQDDRAQTEGCMVVGLLSTPRLVSHDAEFQRRSTEFMRHGWPIKFELHLINTTPHQKKPYLMQDILVTVLLPLLQHYCSSVEVHIEQEPGQLVEELMGIGLRRSGIPLCIGGEWKFEEFFKWCRERQEADSEKYKGHLLFRDFPKYHRLAPVASEQELLNRTATASTKRRLADLLHSRRKRERKRQQVISLKENSQRLTEENVALKVEMERLESLLAEAQALASKLEAATSKT